jgi:hypothetical protein
MGLVAPKGRRFSDAIAASAHFRAVYRPTGDYQLITNPGFNAARPPVNFFRVRIHGQF